MANNWRQTYEQLKKRKKEVDNTSNTRQIKAIDQKYSNPSNNTWKTVAGNELTPGLSTSNRKASNSKVNTVNTTNTTTKKEDNKKWYQKIFTLGEFDDGYDFGDVTKTILGTGTELTKNVSKGALNVVEGAVDIGTYAVAGGQSLLGFDEAAKKTRKFADKDLSEPLSSAAASVSPTGVLYNLVNGKPTDTLNPYGIKYDKDKSLIENVKSIPGQAFNEDKEKDFEKSSLSGYYADKVEELVGYTLGMMFGGQVLTGATGTATTGSIVRDAAGKIVGGSGATFSGGNVGLTVAGKTLNLPTLAFVGGASGGLHEANQKEGVTEAERWSKALSGGLIESVTEGLFGMFGVGGNEFTDELGEKAASLFTSKAGKMLANIGVKSTGESAEEFLSYAANYLVDNNIIDKMGSADFSQKWDWGEVGEQMALAFASSMITQGGGTVLETNSAIASAEKQLGRKLTNEEKAQVTQASIEGSLEEKINKLNAENEKNNIASNEAQLQNEELNNITNQIQELEGQLDTSLNAEQQQEKLNKINELGQQYNEVSNTITQQEQTNSLVDAPSNTLNNVNTQVVDNAQVNNNETKELENSSFLNAQRYEDIVKTNKIEYFTKDNGEVRVNMIDSNNNLVNQIDLYSETQAIKELGEKLGTEIYQKSNPDNQSYYIGNDINNLGSETDYFMTHRPTETGITADNLINQDNETSLPSDVYEHPEYYWNTKEKYTQESLDLVKKIRNNPDALITIYRATPGNTINKGDWVTLSKTYAKQHNESQLEGKGNVVSKQVKASDIQFAGDDINEFGYYPTSDTQNNENATVKKAAVQEELNNTEDTIENDIQEQVEEAIAPVKKELTKTLKELKKTVSEVKQLAEETKALTKEDLPMLEKQYKEAPVQNDAPIRNNLTQEESNELDALDIYEDISEFNNEYLTNRYNELREKENNYFNENTEETIESPLEEEGRDLSNVGSRKVKAYQYEHPEVRPFFQEEAGNLLWELENTIKGERYIIGDTSQMGNGDYQYSGSKRQTSPDIAYLLDEVKMSYSDIEKGLKAIVENHGAENIAAAKRLELIIDDRLRNGYTRFGDQAVYFGNEAAPNQGYINLIQENNWNDYYNSIPGSDIAPKENNLEIAPIKENKIARDGYEAIAPRVNENIDNGGKMIRVSPEMKGKTLKVNNNPVNVDWEAIEDTSKGKQTKLMNTKILNTNNDPVNVDWEALVDTSKAKQVKYNSETQTFEEEDLVKKTKKELRNALMGTEAQKQFIESALDNAKNRSMALMNNTDTIRNTELVFGREAGNIINEMIFQKEINNEADSIQWQNQQRKEIKDLGIKARSKESAAVQKYAEKQYVNQFGELVEYGDSDLAAEFKDVQTQEKIKKAANELRKKYDEYIDLANGVLTKLGFDKIPKRKDYMRHFQELNDVFTRYGIPFNAQSMDEHTLPTDINGLTEYWSPQKNYFANMQERKGIKTTYDAITGIDGYISGISNLIFHTEDIQRGRAFEEMIRETYGEDNGWKNLESLPDEIKQLRAEKIQDNHLSNYAAWVHEWTNNIAGKKNKIDRSVESMFGRKAFSVLDNVRKQVGSNMIGFNLSSSLTNMISTVQAASKTKKLAFAKGTADTIKNMFIKDSFGNTNKFLINRMGTDMISKNAWQKVQDAGFVFMKGMDWFSSNIIVRSKYYENLSKGMDQQTASDEAGKFAARILGDRTKGANAQLYNSKLLGVVTQFQLEVNNQLYSQFYDTYHESKEMAKGNALKMAAGMTFTLGQLAVFTHIFGQAFNAIAGYNPTMDVIEMIKVALGWDDDDDEKTTSERLKEAADMLVDTLPYVNILTGGGRIPVTSGIPNLVGVATGGKDEYGNELKLKDELEKLLYLIPPTGGNQVKKTYQGLSMYDEDLPIAGSYNAKGDLKYTADESTLGKIQAGLFGKWANKDAQDYIDSKFSSISKDKVQEMIDLGMNSTEYRKLQSDISKNSEIKDDKDYTKYSDSEGNTYWYDKENQVVYDDDYNEISIPIVDLKKESSKAMKLDYISSLDLTNDQKNILANNLLNKTTTDKYGYERYTGTEINNSGKEVEKTYWYDSKNDVIYDSKYKEVADKDIADLEKVEDYDIDMSNYDDYSSFEEFDYYYKNPEKYNWLQENNISYTDYVSNSENKKAYDWAYKNPEKYNFSKAITDDVVEYKKYQSDMWDLKADKDEDGNSISGSKKTKVISYVNSLDLSIPQKAMLIRQQYSTFDDYNNEIIDYVSNLNFDYETKKTILEGLKFEVDNDGNVYW